MSKKEQVSRPTKKSEYAVFFATSEAKKGWSDLKAVRLNGLVEAWDTLTTNPLQVSPTCYQLRGELAKVTRNGIEHDRWQLKFSATYGARIWYYVVGQEVFLENVSVGHPNQTK